MKLFLVTFFLCLQTAGWSAGLPPILNSYYQIKDALVAGDDRAAAAAATDMLKAIESVDMKTLTPAEHNAFMTFSEKLIFDARHITETKDIAHQREHFISLSANMFKLAKQVRLSDQPIYEDYCPMKKAYWLSGSTEIRNPYYGSSMPSCGKVAETIKP